ncbi:Amidase [Patulibacter medicamentivorans]|jgi:amidase|uniref:Amidase n=1 Tax=Patulibacter medicamentivorans TaxID=1097667 RepID=H0E8X8_9ACTN|nr:amidase family protein [Patulibacter medicamentivorans]EHN09878.1 Amidase [Patulibacter medicamentivorans]
MPAADPALLRRPAVELAAMIRRGELAAVDLTQAALDRIAELDGRVNAFIDVWAEEALEAAAAIGPGDPRPFAGVPTAIKNNRGVAGKRLTLGASFTEDDVAPSDHNVTRRLRGAGFVLVGSTNLPEWGITPVTRPRRFGPTRNPWDLERTPGGSSGGAAAAVAAGMLPVAHGNDGGGSIRIPAACCGLVGLKSQRGRVSLAPDLGHHLLVVDGMLTRTVADAAATLDVLAGYETGDVAWAPPAAASFADLARRGLEPNGIGRPLRIAVATTPPLDGDPDPVDLDAARRAAELLSGLGHRVEEVDAPWQLPGLLELFTASFGPGIASQIRVAELRRGRDVTPEDVEALSWEMWQRATAMRSVDYLLADGAVQAVGRQIVTWADPYDVILTPALGSAPVAIGDLDPDGPDPMDGFRRGGHFTPYTALGNVTGSPAITLPLFARPAADPAAGMPLGVQLLGRPADEATLLALASQLEAAAPWSDRVAPLALEPQADRA